MSEKRSVSSARGIRRGDAVIVDANLRDGAFVRVKEAKTLSLVGLPANQTAFKVLRSDEGTPMNPIRRTRRSTESSPVMRISFPEGTDEAGVGDALKNYGLSGYTVEKNAEGIFTATRSDLKSISPDNTIQIKLNEEGLTATVARQDTPAATTGEKAGVTLAWVEFDDSKFTLEEVKRWSTEKSVDGAVQEPQNAGDCYKVRRSEVREGEETRRMTLEDGVTAVLVRSDVYSIPDGMIAVVSEAAYGSWGWGQLDFMALMAGRNFNEMMEDSIYALRSVMEQIMLYSQLPLDTRKDLANRALGQFGDYIGAILDSLPRQLLVSVARSANPSQEKSMTKANTAATETPIAASTTATPEADKPLTRSDIVKMLEDSQTATVAAAVLAIRSAFAPATPAVEAKPEPTEALPLTRADLAGAFAEAVKPLVDRIEAQEGKTVVRSAEEATPVAVVVAANEEAKDVFRGAFPGLRGRTK